MKKLSVLAIALLCSLLVFSQENDYVNEAKIQYSKKNYEGAVILLNHAVKADKDNYELLVYRAKAKVKLGDVQSGIQDLNKAVRLSGENTEIYRIRGFAYLLAGQNSKAVADFNKVLKANTKDEKSLFFRGVASYKLNTSDGGCEDWTRSKELGCEKSDQALNMFCGRG